MTRYQHNMYPLLLSIHIHDPVCTVKTYQNLSNKIKIKLNSFKVFYLPIFYNFIIKCYIYIYTLPFKVSKLF